MAAAVADFQIEEGERIIGRKREREREREIERIRWKKRDRRRGKKI